MSNKLSMEETFKKFDDLDWKLTLDDSGEGDWQENWAFDGKECELSNSTQGLSFKSGVEAGNNAHHGVLWTKESFKGDMKVSFNFTRLDTVNRYVNILYFHANGIGEGDYKKDIHAWPELREVPFMKTYFEKMDLLHISFAAFSNNNDDADDYIRVRRYPVREDRSFGQIEVDGTIHETGLFLPNVSYDITFIKTKAELSMEIRGDGKVLHHLWDISKVDVTEEGPFGIRQMWQKHSIYKDIKIFTR